MAKEGPVPSRTDDGPKHAMKSFEMVNLTGFTVGTTKPWRAYALTCCLTTVSSVLTQVAAKSTIDKPSV